jgi:MGT family glycosyltransferase
MARFLMTVWPLSGHLHPNLAVANALRAQGHDVAFYTGERGRSNVESEGYKLYPFRHVNEARFNELLRAIGKITLDWTKTPQQLGYWREWLLGTLPGQLADLEEALADWRPDALVCDPTMWAPTLILHEARPIPVAVFSYVATCLLPGPGAPIPGFPLPRPRTTADRFARQVLQAALNLAAFGTRQGVNVLRRRYGLPPLGTSMTDYTGRMPLYLVQGIPEFDYNRQDLPPSVHYVGNCPWDRPSNEPPLAFLGELSHDRPWVYVTEGTAHFREPLALKAAVHGLADAPVQVIATSNHSPTELGVSSLPANFRLERWIPYSDLVPRVDLIVTTGGTNTIMQALTAGVPLIIVPSSWEQPESAWRVAEAGVGLRLSPRDCTPEKLRVAVETILATPSFRQNARLFSDILGRYGGAGYAAELLGNLITRVGERHTPSFQGVP